MPFADQSPERAQRHLLQSSVLSLSALGILTIIQRRERLYKCIELALIDARFASSLRIKVIVIFCVSRLIHLIFLTQLMGELSLAPFDIQLLTLPGLQPWAASRSLSFLPTSQPQYFFPHLFSKIAILQCESNKLGYLSLNFQLNNRFLWKFDILPIYFILHSYSDYIQYKSIMGFWGFGVLGEGFQCNISLCRSPQ